MKYRITNRNTGEKIEDDLSDDEVQEMKSGGFVVEPLDYKPPDNPYDRDWGAAMRRGAAQGASLGFSDELAGLVGDDMDKDESRMKNELARRGSPVSYSVGEFLGSIPTSLAGAAATSVGSKALQAARASDIGSKAKAIINSGEVGKSLLDRLVTLLPISSVGKGAALGAVSGGISGAGYSEEAVPAHEMADYLESERKLLDGGGEIDPMSEEAMPGSKNVSMSKLAGDTLIGSTAGGVAGMLGGAVGGKLSKWIGKNKLDAAKMAKKVDAETGERAGQIVSNVYDDSAPDILNRRLGDAKQIVTTSKQIKSREIHNQILSEFRNQQNLLTEAAEYEALPAAQKQFVSGRLKNVDRTLNRIAEQGWGEKEMRNIPDLKRAAEETIDAYVALEQAKQVARGAQVLDDAAVRAEVINSIYPNLDKRVVGGKTINEIFRFTKDKDVISPKMNEKQVLEAVLNDTIERLQRRITDAPMHTFENFGDVMAGHAPASLIRNSRHVMSQHPMDLVAPSEALKQMEKDEEASMLKALEEIEAARRRKSR